MVRFPSTFFTTQDTETGLRPTRKEIGKEFVPHISIARMSQFNDMVQKRWRIHSVAQKRDLPTVGTQSTRAASVRGV